MIEKVLNETSVTPKITLTQKEYNDLVALARMKAKKIEERADDVVLETDLGADSFNAVEIVMALEHEFGISIPDEKMYNNEGCMIKDVYDLVEELL